MGDQYDFLIREANDKARWKSASDHPIIIDLYDNITATSGTLQTQIDSKYHNIPLESSVIYLVGATGDFTNLVDAYDYARTVYPASSDAHVTFQIMDATHTDPNPIDATGILVNTTITSSGTEQYLISVTNPDYVFMHKSGSGELTIDNLTIDFNAFTFSASYFMLAANSGKITINNSYIPDFNYGINARNVSGFDINSCTFGPPGIGLVSPVDGWVFDNCGTVTITDTLSRKFKTYALKSLNSTTVQMKGTITIETGTVLAQDDARISFQNTPPALAYSPSLGVMGNNQSFIYQEGVHSIATEDYTDLAVAGVDLSSYATTTELNTTSGTLQNQIAPNTVHSSLTDETPHADPATGLHHTAGFYLNGYVPTTSGVEGEVYWDPDYHTLALVTGLGNTVQVGTELFGVGRNETGADITEAEAKVVYSSNVTGWMMDFDLADASDINKCSMVGLTTAAALQNALCPISTFGLVNGLNITAMQLAAGETWAEGNTLYLSADGSGNVTNVNQVHPIHSVYIGVLIRHHSTQGQIFVNPHHDSHSWIQLNEYNITTTSGTLQAQIDVLGSSGQSVYTNTAASGNITPDFASYNYFDITQSGTVSLTNYDMANEVGYTGTMSLYQGPSVGDKDIAFGTYYQFPNGTPTLASGINDVNIFRYTVVSRYHAHMEYVAGYQRNNSIA